jgi:hypothetical protein
MITVVSLYKRYTRAVYTLVLTLLTKNYIAIAALLANATNNLYCVHNIVFLL